MNRSFENIFEKYKVNCENSKRSRRRPRSQSSVYQKKEIAVWTKSALGNSMSSDVSNAKDCSCFFNTLSKAKYKNATRYSRLEITAVQREKFRHTQNSPFNKSVDICESKENNGRDHLCGNLDESAICHGKQTNVITNFKDRLLDRSDLETQYETTKNVPFTSQANFEDKGLKEHNQTFESTFSQHPESKNSHLFTIQHGTNSPTELDLLLDLIQQGERYNEDLPKDKTNAKYINCNSLLRTKPCLKDGFQEMFERALKQEKVKSNFLKYDKKIGLRSGQILTVVKIETTHGMTLAMVTCQNLNKSFAVVVSREMMPRLKIGAQIETFFDDNTMPYKLLSNGEYLDVYLEPYKLLID